MRAHATNAFNQSGESSAEKGASSIGERRKISQISTAQSDHDGSGEDSSPPSKKLKGAAHNEGGHCFSVGSAPAMFELPIRLSNPKPDFGGSMEDIVLKQKNHISQESEPDHPMADDLPDELQELRESIYPDCSYICFFGDPSRFSSRPTGKRPVILQQRCRPEPIFIPSSRRMTSSYVSIECATESGPACQTLHINLTGSDILHASAVLCTRAAMDRILENIKTHRLDDRQTHISRSIANIRQSKEYSTATVQQRPDNQTLGVSAASDRTHSEVDTKTVELYCKCPPGKYCTRKSIRTTREMICVAGIAYDNAEIRLMASEILSSRASGELPASTTPLTDPVIVVEDWGILQMLRMKRGNPSSRPSAEYESLRAEIRRTYHERDSDRSDAAAKAVARERIEFFLRAAAKENDQISDALTRSGGSFETDEELSRAPGAGGKWKVSEMARFQHLEAQKHVHFDGVSAQAHAAAAVTAEVLTVEAASAVRERVRESVQKAMEDAMKPITGQIAQTATQVQALQATMQSWRTEMLRLLEKQMVATDRVETARFLDSSSVRVIDEQMKKALREIRDAQEEGIQLLHLEELRIKNQLCDEMDGRLLDSVTQHVGEAVEDRVLNSVDERMALWLLNNPNNPGGSQGYLGC